MLDIFVSTATDDSMKSLDGNFASVLPARTAWLAQHDIRPTDTTLVQLVYEGDDYTRYATADDSLRGDGIVRTPSIATDGIATTTPGLALFLPLADCIGAVLHDPVKNVLMLTHLGRHNLIQFGGTNSVQYMTEQFGCAAKDITAWLSPAAGGKNYPLHDFDNRSMHDIATEQLIAAGITPQNITRSPVDTTTDERYFSHSEFLKGHQKTDGRFAVVARLTNPS